ncbi:MAG TPA: inositol monophosphatase family protein [Patescibacteria group bacterium]|nr:inositol monophosphatase family protein [Patescibacteria group bacterium]
MKDDKEIVAAMKDAAFAAGGIQMESYGKKLKISHKKSPRDFVTEIDLKSQEAIVESLLKSMLRLGYLKNEIGFISEEGIDTKAKHLFIIDPLDGTSGYIEGNDKFAISICYAKEDAILIGLIYQPTENAFYIAEKGRGAFKATKNKLTRLQVLARNGPPRLAYNLSSDDKISKKVMHAADKLKRTIKSASRGRSVTLTAMSVVENDFQIMLNSHSFIWDIAAAKLITEEAGGLMLDWQGGEIKLDFTNSKKRYEFVLASKALTKQTTDTLNKRMKLLIIGAITNSEATYSDGVRRRFGGGVIYGAKVAIQLGINTTVVTIGAEDIDRGVAELKNLGINTYRIGRPTSNNFSNDYRSKQVRKLYMRSIIKTPIQYEEIPVNPNDFDCVIFCPTMTEINTKTISRFPLEQLKLLDAQGFARKNGYKNSSGLISVGYASWKITRAFSKKVNVLKVSHEDLPGIDLPPSQTISEKCRKLLSFGFEVVAITQAEEKTLIAGRGVDFTEIPTHKADVIDSAGAGDTFNVAFVYKYFETGDPIESAVFANKIAALKISGKELPKSVENF